MPVISTFYGILIRMFYNDHEPAHFHVQYAEYQAIIDIDALCLMKGQLPNRALELINWSTKLR